MQGLHAAPVQALQLALAAADKRPSEQVSWCMLSQRKADPGSSPHDSLRSSADADSTSRTHKPLSSSSAHTNSQSRLPAPAGLPLPRRQKLRHSSLSVQRLVWGGVPQLGGTDAVQQPTSCNLRHSCVHEALLRGRSAHVTQCCRLHRCGCTAAVPDQSGQLGSSMPRPLAVARLVELCTQDTTLQQVAPGVSTAACAAPGAGQPPRS